MELEQISSFSLFLSYPFSRVFDPVLFSSTGPVVEIPSS